jgi:hypothetical protein
VICVKDHKRRFNCSGVRDKFSNKNSLKDYDENDFYRDMKYINETISDTNRASKTMFNIENKDEETVMKEKKHKNLKKLSKKFRNVNLECSPYIMKRFKENNSYCDSKMRKFYWTVKFIFLENKMEYILKDPFDDSEYTLDKIFTEMINNKEELDMQLLQHVNTINPENIKFLYKDNTALLKFIRIEKEKYVECDRNMILKDLLDGKTIYEYPELYII